MKVKQNKFKQSSISYKSRKSSFSLNNYFGKEEEAKKTVGPVE